MVTGDDMKKQSDKVKATDKDKMFRMSDVARSVSVKSVLTEEEKLAYVKSRFKNINEDDLMDGDEFWKRLNENHDF